MNSFIAITTVSLLSIISGWYYSSHINRISIIEKLSLSFALGSGLTTWLWFILYRLSFPFTLSTYLIATLAVFAIGYITKNTQSKGQSFKWNTLLLLPLIICISAFIIGLSRPLTAWDSIALYDFRGHVIASSHSLNDLTSSTYDISYPLYISLIHAVIYLLGAVSAQGIHSLFFTSLIGISYGLVSRWSKPKYGILAAILVAISFEVFDHSTFAYTNLPYTLFLIAGILYLIEGERNTLIVGMLAVGLSTWTRSSEPFWILGLALLTYQSLKAHNYRHLFLGLLLLFGLRYGWTSYFNQVVSNLNLTTLSPLDSLAPNTINQIIANIPDYYWYLRLNVIDPYHGQWFALIPLSIVSIYTKNHKLILLAIVAIITLLMVIAGTIIMSTYYTTWSDIGTSARRMVLFITPLIAISLSYAFSQIPKKD